MDTGKIKALATGARVQLMDGVRASLERVLAPDSAESINEPGRVNELRSEAKDKEALIERVAYTWFNRLCALRLMDSRGYTPVPVVTPRTGETMPAILADARRGTFYADFPLRPANKQRVVELLSGSTDSVNPLGEAYVILLLSACDYYAKPIPALFGSNPSSANAMRLLAPTSLLAEDSVLQRIVEGMDEESCKEVEVMGWLYQFYIEERRAEINIGFKASGKAKLTAGPKEIAPATQIFTPNWIVRYMVENSLGRLWMLNFPDSDLADRMDYYIAPGKPETNFLRIDSPEEITFLDPAMGSGHILVYAFDLLYDMYIEEGYRPAEIPTLILQRNLTGFEIDDRAAEIAIFALSIKARERDTDFFAHAVQPDVTVFHSVEFDSFELQDAGLIAGHAKLLGALAHLDEIGSLYQPEPADVVLLENAVTNLTQQEGIFAGHALGNIEVAANIVKQLTRVFSVVVANPPYLGSGNTNAWLSDWVKNYYPDEKGDLCTCFIKRNLAFVTTNGYSSIITSDTCMYLTSYAALRRHLINSTTIISLVDTRGTNAHPDVFDANMGIVLHKSRRTEPFFGDYFKLDQKLADKDGALLYAIHNEQCTWIFHTNAEWFLDIPGSPFDYWISPSMHTAFSDAKRLGSVVEAREGMITGDNNRFLRIWSEVSISDMGLPGFTRDGKKWLPIQKGGSYRLWYGNNTFVVNWENDGWEIQHDNFSGTRLRAHNFNGEHAFRRGITWNSITTSDFHCRYSPAGFMYDTAGPLCEVCDPSDFNYVLGLMSSSLFRMFMKAMNPTINFPPNYIEKTPYIRSVAREREISELVDKSIHLSKVDWDSTETSWDFKSHPALQYKGDLKAAMDSLEIEMGVRVRQLKSNEEALNALFATIYNMDGEVPVEVPDDKLSIRRFDRLSEIKSLISYAVGCMFGRYSLDIDGLVLADQGSTIKDYLARISNPIFMPDEDGILPITEEEWFDDDIVTEFWRWLKAAFGEEHFDENLAYIEETLGCKLREYFIKGKKSAFYDDHCKTYSVTGSGKRPIYWMFSSPKSSFNCLVYLHRYDDRTVSKILTEYVRELRRKLEIQTRSLEASDIARDRTCADKYHDMIDELNDWERDVLYPMAQRHIKIDLDDGVRHNYKLFPGALRKVTGLS